MTMLIVVVIVLAAINSCATSVASSRLELAGAAARHAPPPIAPQCQTRTHAFDTLHAPPAYRTHFEIVWHCVWYYLRVHCAAHTHVRRMRVASTSHDTVCLRCAAHETRLMFRRRAMLAGMDEWCNVATNNPSVSHNPSCGPKPHRFYALKGERSSSYGPAANGTSAWRCYGAVGLSANHTTYLGTSKCYSSETCGILP